MLPTIMLWFYIPSSSLMLYDVQKQQIDVIGCQEFVEAGSKVKYGYMYMDIDAMLWMPLQYKHPNGFPP